MRAGWLAGRGLRAFAAPLLMVGLLIGFGQGQALALACVDAAGTGWKQVTGA